MSDRILLLLLRITARWTGICGHIAPTRHWARCHLPRHHTTEWHTNGHGYHWNGTHHRWNYDPRETLHP